MVVALVHVDVAVGALEANLADAAVVVPERDALGSVPAGVGVAGIIHWGLAQGARDKRE